MRHCPCPRWFLYTQHLFWGSLSPRMEPPVPSWWGWRGWGDASGTRASPTSLLTEEDSTADSLRHTRRQVHFPAQGPSLTMRPLVRAGGQLQHCQGPRGMGGPQGNGVGERGSVPQGQWGHARSWSYRTAVATAGTPGAVLHMPSQGPWHGTPSCKMMRPELRVSLTAV